MTYSGEGDSIIANADFEELPEYPSAFGITFTPQVTGISLAVAGLLAAGYIIMTFFMPSWETYQTSIGDKKARLDQVNAQEFSSLLSKVQTLKGEIAKAETDQKQLYSLFADDKTVNTLLLDINKFVEAKGAKIINFEPQIWQAEIVADGSLGEAVNNKLKRQVVTLSMEGTFIQTQSILREIEKLQPLLILKDFTSEVSEKPVFIFDQNQLKPSGEPLLKTSFTIDLIVPLSEEELVELKKAEEEAAAAATKGKEGGKKPPAQEEKKPAETKK
jgi:hypothetical protein